MNNTQFDMHLVQAVSVHTLHLASNILQSLQVSSAIKDYIVK